MNKNKNWLTRYQRYNPLSRMSFFSPVKSEDYFSQTFHDVEKNKH